MTSHSDFPPFANIRRVAVTGSTNSDVLELGRQGESEGLVIVAERQTSGRGRHDRVWVAPPGTGLLFSTLLRPPASAVALVTATAALAVADTAAAFGATGLGIKWPNDVVLADDDTRSSAPERKLAGILAEADWVPGATPSGGPVTARPPERVLVALGIGLNLTTSDDFPPEVAERRVALCELVDRCPDADDVLHEILAVSDDWYSRLVASPGAVLDEWRARCITIGRRVRVDLGARDLVGVATDVDTSGRLVVSGDDGIDHVVAAGDVVHLRDAR